MFDQLFEECPWRQRSDSYNGEQYLQPRLTAWFGDLPYSYSGVTLDVNKDVGCHFYSAWRLCCPVDSKTCEMQSNSVECYTLAQTN